MSQELVHRPMDMPVPLGNLDQYLAAVGRYEVLDAEEEQRLARELRERQDLDAARRLILHNLRFVVHVARGYSGYGLPLGDLVQAQAQALQLLRVQLNGDLFLRQAGDIHLVDALIQQLALE